MSAPLKSFAELCLDRRFADGYLIKWRAALLDNAVSRSKGFNSETVCEASISAFVNAVIAENVKGFAFDVLQPHLVTVNKTNWHDLELPDWRVEPAKKH